MMSEGGGPANAVDPCVWVVGLVSPLFYGSSSTRIILASPLHTMRSTRAPSPTLTSFSGISNYRTESYKPLRDKSSVPTLPVDSYQVARTHYDELSKYLSAYLAKGSISSLSPFAHSHVHPPQNPQTLALQHDRNSRGLHANSSRNYLQMSSMN